VPLVISPLRALPCLLPSFSASTEDLMVVCAVCEENWPTSRLEEHSELCAVLSQVRGTVCA
jgi:hypothetical protein